MPSDTSTTAMLRLHPSSLLFSIGAAARRLILPGLVVLFAAARGAYGYEIWLMILFVPAVLTSLVRYWSLRYRLGDEELVIRDGIVTRNERHIPYDRIQNVDLVQNPLHRMLGVAEVRLETAGGEKPEATLRVLSRPDIEQLRTRVFAGRGVGDGATETPAALADPALGVGEGKLVCSMPTAEVVRFGIISNQGMVLVAAIFGLLWQADLLENALGRLNLDLTELDELPAGVPLPGPVAAAVAGLGLLLSLLVLLRIFSVIWALFSLYGFRLTRRGEDLRSEYGLFTRVTKTIPRGRIQRVAVKETVLHRWFGRVAVQVETAGGVSEEEQASAGNRLWLAPLIRRDALPALVAEALPGLELEQADWEPLAPRARRRLIRRAVILSLPVAVVGLIVLRPWGFLLALPVLGLGLVHATQFVRHAGWAVGAHHVLFRSGWWVRRGSFAPFGKIQVLELSETPFDRRNRMATVDVDTAGAGRVGHTIAVPLLEVDVATRLRDRLAHEAVARAFRW